MNKRYIVLVCLVSASLLSFPAGCSTVERAPVKGTLGSGMIPEEAEKSESPIPLEAASVKRGKALYNKHCSSCHGASAKGDGPKADRISNRASNLTHSIANKTEDELAWIIAGGFGHMPAWKHVLSERDIQDVLNYIRMLGQRLK